MRIAGSRRWRLGRRCLVLGTVVGVVAAALPAAATTQLVWNRTYDYGGGGGTAAVDVAVDPGNGNVYVLARDDCCPLSSYDTIAYSSSGTQLWEHATSTKEDLPAAITVDAATGDVIVTGSRNLNVHELYTKAYSATGTTLWTKTYTSTGHDYAAAGITDDGHGRVVVAGTVTQAGNGDYFVAAYKVSDGTLVWHKTYVGPFGHSEAEAIAADPGSSAVYVTGVSEGDNFSELTTIGYSSATGTRLWVARDTGLPDVAKGIAVDPTNHHVYAITADASAGLAIYAYSSGGALLWDTGPDDANAVSGIPMGVSVDASNDRVYVTGYDETAHTTHSVLAAYSAGGALAWSRNLHSSTSDLTWDVFADAANHRVYVAGEHDDASGNLEFATYAETSTGTSAWSAEHASPVSGGQAEPQVITGDTSRKQVYVVGEENKGSTADADTLAYRS